MEHIFPGNCQFGCSFPLLGLTNSSTSGCTRPWVVCVQVPCSLAHWARAPGIGSQDSIGCRQTRAFQYIC